MRLPLFAFVLALGCHPTAAAPTPPTTEPPPPSEPTIPVVGSDAPALDLVAVDGTPVSLPTAATGRPIVIVFGSFTCPLFRMKTPGFEERATAWGEHASFYIVYTHEAHPQGRGYDRLSGFAKQVAQMDADGDNIVTLAEYQGPREMFDPFDIDKDEVLHAHELLAAQRIAQFDDFAEPTTIEQRRAAAQAFREEVPGAIPVLVDPIGEPAAHAYGDMPNSAFVIDRDGKIAAAMPWATVREVDATLAKLTGRAAPVRVVATPSPDVLAPHLERARAAKTWLLVQFSAPGCGACEKLREGALTDSDVKRNLATYEHVELSVDLDPNWTLFEALELTTTPAFVLLDEHGSVRRKLQGSVKPAELAEFLSTKRR